MTNGRSNVASRAARLVGATCALLTVLVPITAGAASAPRSNGQEARGPLVPLYAGPSTGSSTTVGSDVRPRVTGRSATIAVTYDGFSAQAKAAFQAAVNIWKTKLDSSVTIHVEAHWTDLGADTGILGAAGPTSIHRNWTGGTKPVANTWYPSALANKLAGRDLNGDEAEIVAQFNDQFPNWYFGTTGPTPSNKYDLESVILHELGHGFGFLTSFQEGTGGQILWGTSGSPWIEDTFVTNSAGQLATRFPSGSTQFKGAVTGNNLFWNGNQGKKANGGTRPKLYAPNPWESGSSASHLDENTYPAGDPDSLMTPFLGMGERVVDPGPIALGVLGDSGWKASSK